MAAYWNQKNLVKELPGDALSKDWLHVATSYDAKTKKRTLYVNGESTNSETISQDPQFQADGGLWIGRIVVDSDVNERVLKGLITEVRVWNTVRTEKQINDNKLRYIPRQPLFARTFSLSSSVHCVLLQLFGWQAVRSAVLSGRQLHHVTTRPEQAGGQQWQQL